MSIESKGLEMQFSKINWLFIIWLIALIFVLVGSLIPVTHVPGVSLLVTDKVQHAAAYFLLGITALYSGQSILKKILMYLVSFSIGVAIEFLQPFTGRHFEINDIVANSAGLFVSLLVYLVVMRKKQRRATAN
ncbi:MAG: VanZ family protein [Sneathiella sp.]|nr:VanZ family protein [Sneathiella sp.]